MFVFVVVESVSGAPLPPSKTLSEVEGREEGVGGWRLCTTEEEDEGMEV
jgi:hypothetical protein